MPSVRTHLATLLWAAAVTCLSAGAGAACRDNALALQVLGSGGPIADDARASSGYLLWRNGKAVVLIDAGGGVFQRFGAAGGNIKNLDLIALTHFHTDHAADLPAILKGAYFSERSRPLTISGPDGHGPFPPLKTFLTRMFGQDQGAFAYLSGLRGGSADLPPLNPVTINHASQKPQSVYDDNGLAVQAVGVHHGPVPALGYLISVDGARIAVSGDQNLSTDYFTDMIHGADLFVMPAAIPEYERPAALHARPSEIGEAAARANVGKLVLSHWMARSLEEQDKNIGIAKQAFGGPLAAASDMQCFALITAKAQRRNPADIRP